MFITNLFKSYFNQKCSHQSVAPEVEQAYCPDCGKLIKNEWYITRCSCCGVKMKAMVRGENVVPQYHYCSNCGSKEFSVEKIEKINFIDINFAVLIKKEVEEEFRTSTTRCWQEKTALKPKLLVQYL